MIRRFPRRNKCGNIGVVCPPVWPHIPPTSERIPMPAVYRAHVFTRSRIATIVQLGTAASYWGGGTLCPSKSSACLVRVDVARLHIEPIPVEWIWEFAERHARICIAIFERKQLRIPCEARGHISYISRPSSSGSATQEVGPSTDVRDAVIAIVLTRVAGLVVGALRIKFGTVHQWKSQTRTPLTLCMKYPR